MNAVMEGFRRVGDFQGRTAQKRFWPYVITIVVANMVLGFIGGMAAMAPAMGRIFQEAAAAGRTAREAGANGPPPYDPAGQAAFTRDIMASMMGPFMWVSIALGVIGMLLLLAIVVRRLHDSGKTGWWSLLPLPGLAVSYVFTLIMMSRIEEMLTPVGLNPRFQMWSSLISALYWGGLIALLFLVTRSSTPGDNRFGPEPDGAEFEG